MRKKLLFGNWKMNKTSKEAEDFGVESIQLLEFANKKNVEIGIAPSFLSLATLIKANPKLNVASQNCHFESHGAFTGEISIPMLKEIGVSWSIIGHSERRLYNNETSKICNKKIVSLLINNMTPIYCVGETLEEFESGKTKEVVKKQINEGLANLSDEDASKIVIAYEPVWAIGTGKNASSEIAESVCAYIRKLLKDMFSESVSETVRILYGGSVKPNNIKAYLENPDVDGALVGGASLTASSFKELIANI